MTSDLNLALNLSDLDLVAKFNHIYPGHVTAIITINLFFLNSIILFIEMQIS